jgi:26S proteasome regulatory subunit N2
MSFALGAGDLFDLSEKSEFVETIIGICPWNRRSPIAHCVELYIASQQRLFELQNELNPNNPQFVEGNTKQDERLERVVEKMFQRCIDDKEYTQVTIVVVFVEM